MWHINKIIAVQKTFMSTCTKQTKGCNNINNQEYKYSETKIKNISKN